MSVLYAHGVPSSYVRAGQSVVHGVQTPASPSGKKSLGQNNGSRRLGMMNSPADAATNTSKSKSPSTSDTVSDVGSVNSHVAMGSAVNASAPSLTSHSTPSLQSDAGAPVPPNATTTSRWPSPSPATSATRTCSTFCTVASLAMVESENPPNPLPRSSITRLPPDEDDGTAYATTKSTVLPASPSTLAAASAWMRCPVGSVRTVTGVDHAMPPGSNEAAPSCSTYLTVVSSGEAYTKSRRLSWLELMWAPTSSDAPSSDPSSTVSGRNSRLGAAAYMASWLSARAAAATSVNPLPLKSCSRTRDTPGASAVTTTGAEKKVSGW